MRAQFRRQLRRIDCGGAVNQLQIDSEARRALFVVLPGRAAFQALARRPSEPLPYRRGDAASLTATPDRDSTDGYAAVISANARPSANANFQCQKYRQSDDSEVLWLLRCRLSADYPKDRENKERKEQEGNASKQNEFRLITFGRVDRRCTSCANSFEICHAISLLRMDKQPIFSDGLCSSGNPLAM